MKDILFATGNPHKLDEVRAVFHDLGVEILGLNDIGAEIEEPVEDQETFIGNALLKAKYYAERTGRVCLADDSGLVVDALDGEPGVISARYAGVAGGRDVVDPANNRKLVEKLAGVEQADRTARFVCAMVLHDGEKELASAIGKIEGEIVSEPRGENGFGYDPHFLVSGRDLTSAELSPEEKNAISHRGKATRVIHDLIVKNKLLGD